MIQAQEVNHQILSNLLRNDRYFWRQVEDIVKKVNIQSKRQQKLYPWNSIQATKLIQQINQVIIASIKDNLHDILNRQFINVSNQILIIRDQVSQFIHEQSQKSKEANQQLTKQIQQIKKKIATKQIINNNSNTTYHPPRISRSNAGIDLSEKKIQSEISSIKQQIEKLRISTSVSIEESRFEENCSALESSLNETKMQMRLKMQELKQKTNKALELYDKKITQSSSKELIAAQIKKSLKVNLKIYSDQFQKINKKIEKNDDSISSMSKQLHEYLGSQLKSAWLIISNLKRRLENIEESCNIMNSSFVME